MFEIIASYIEEHHLLPDRGKVIVAVSGGADSLCLLHLLHRLCGPGKRYPALSLHVAHLNHQLRGEASDRDAEQVEHIATMWDLPVTIGVTDVPALARREQRSLEDAARVARYCFLREVAQGQPIAVAHHRDDQVETLLLHWLRGGGIASMVGLQPRQQDIIRPLLTVTHADTVAYCHHHQLTPLEDASNRDPHFLRNRIRYELIPLLESMNTGIRETLLRNAEVMHTDYEWIESQVTAHWPTVIIAEQDEKIQLDVQVLQALPLSLQRHTMRRVTARLSAGQSPLELRHYRLIEQLLQRTSNGKTPEKIQLNLPQQLHVTRYGDTLVFERAQDHKNRYPHSIEKNTEVSLPIPGNIAIPGTNWTAMAEIVSDEVTQQAKTALHQGNWAEVWRILPSARYAVYIDADSLQGGIPLREVPERDCRLRVRTRRAGDRMRPLGMSHEKKIQDVLVDKHIPRAERDQIPIFFSAEHCVWLAGVQLDDRARLSRETQRIIRLSIIQTTQQAREVSG